MDVEVIVFSEMKFPNYFIINAMLHHNLRENLFGFIV